MGLLEWVEDPVIVAMERWGEPRRPLQPGEVFGERKWLGSLYSGFAGPALIGSGGPGPGGGADGPGWYSLPDGHSGLGSGSRTSQ